MTDHQKLIEELEALAARERRDGNHVRGPAFHPPWGQDIIDKHNTDAETITRAAQAIRSLEGEVLRLSQSQPCGDGGSAAAPEAVRPGEVG